MFRLEIENIYLSTENQSNYFFHFFSLFHFFFLSHSLAIQSIYEK